MISCSVPDGDQETGAHMQLSETTSNYLGGEDDYATRHPLGPSTVYGWGRDGWDAGNGYVRMGMSNGAGTYTAWQYVEGDITVWTFDNLPERDAKLDMLCIWYWLRGSVYVGNDKEAMEADPSDIRFRGPFTWARLTEYEETGTDPYAVMLAEQGEGK